MKPMIFQAPMIRATMSPAEAKLPLQRYRRAKYNASSVTPLVACLPFVENSRAVLIHRPKTAASIALNKMPHMAVLFYCGNGTTGGKNLTFLSEPPPDAILCETCEKNAVAAGLPPADALAGRHVHKGRIKPIMTCGCAEHEGAQL